MPATEFTTDDEAFIRNILANPGEDLPRLVYADWLEERGDERGTYLRHESLWAKAKDNDGANRLRTMAKELDAVWVARVSRPPVGVCCEHLTFNGPKRPDLSLEAIVKFEAKIRLRLPVGYQAFLVNYNGGRFATKHVCLVQHESFPVLYPLAELFSILKANSKSKSHLAHVIDRYRESTSTLHYSGRWLQNFFPIGRSRGHQYFVGTGAQNTDMIFIGSYQESYDPNAMSRIASSFGDFLANLGSISGLLSRDR